MTFFWSYCVRHFRGIGDPWWSHSLDCLFSSGSHGQHPVSSVVRTRQTKASPSRSWWLTCILAVSVSRNMCTSVRLCGTYYAQIFQISTRSFPSHLKTHASIWQQCHMALLRISFCDKFVHFIDMQLGFWSRRVFRTFWTNVMVSQNKRDDWHH